jgi:hypothetical protein
MTSPKNADVTKLEAEIAKTEAELATLGQREVGFRQFVEEASTGLGARSMEPDAAARRTLDAHERPGESGLHGAYVATTHRAETATLVAMASPTPGLRALPESSNVDQRDYLLPAADGIRCRGRRNTGTSSPCARKANQLLR